MLKLIVMISVFLLLSSSLVYAGWEYYVGGSDHNQDPDTHIISQENNKVYSSQNWTGKDEFTKAGYRDYISSEYESRNNALLTISDTNNLFLEDNCRYIKCPIVQRGYLCAEEALISTEEVTDGAYKIALAASGHTDDCLGRLGMPFQYHGFMFDQTIRFEYPIPLV